ncbi:hypothetical protein O0L34_g12005 [Tuta absoluta]|nr:hypothetical protein O0L34_g12005 [Tuta absoluta]
MASDYSVLRTCGGIICLILQVLSEPQSPVDPWIVSFKVSERNCDSNSCKYLLNVHGGEFLGHYSWRLTPVEDSRGGGCDVISPDYELREINTDQWETQVEVLIPHNEGKTFFCLRHYEKTSRPFGGQWVHQGADLFLQPKNDAVSTYREAKNET